MRESAIMYRNFMRAVQKLPPEKRGEAYEAYLMYAYDGEEYSGDNFSIAALVECFRAQLDSDRIKYAAQVDRAKKAVSTRSSQGRDEVVTTLNQSRDEVVGVNVNVNVNDNVKSGKDTRAKPTKRKMGEREHVLLTDEEYAKLVSQYGEQQTREAIEYLDEYIERKGYKAKSHYLAIKKWVFVALREEEIQKQELAQREQRLNRAPKGQFVQRKDDIDGAVLNKFLERMGK